MRNKLIVIRPIVPYLYVSKKLIKIWQRHIHCVAPPDKYNAISFWM